jgi:WhiB family redox-sensing transcriptional regulator
MEAGCGMTDTQDWRQEGLCGQVGGDLWFPHKGGNNRPAKRVCATCPVRQECLDDVMARTDVVDDYGIRGGTSPRERDRMRARMREAA